MKRRISLIITAAMLLSLTACSGTEDDTLASAEPGETYSGAVTVISLEYIVVSTDDGDVRISYSEDTEFSGFSGGMGGMENMGDMGDAPGQPGNGDGETPPDMEGAEDAEGTEAPEDIELPEDMGTPEDMDVPEEAENSGAEEDSAAADDADGESGITELETEGNPADEPGQQTSSCEDLALNDEVTVVVGDDGIAETVTLSMETGDGENSSSAPEDYDAANEYTSDTEISGVELSSDGTDENAVLVGTEDITVSLDDVVISRASDDSTGGDDSSFYGVGAAALVTDGILSVSDSTIASDAAGGAGVFAYGNGTAYVSDTVITTEQDTSGGIHVAGGGALYAWDLTVETRGESSAAIRSDRGSGTMVVDGGSYTSNGVNSPAVYSTADITIHDAGLTANGSEAICIEGLNSIRLFDCDLSGNMSDMDQNGCTWNVILYQSMSGDSEEGNSTFEMVGGTLTAENGGMFYTTNTESTFIISGVEITGAEDSEFLLKCTGNSNERGWGTAGANGADCNFTAIDQILEGDVIWDSISQLDLYLTEGSVLTGALVQDESDAGDGGDGYADLYIDADSTWVVTGDSTLTSLSCAGTITDEDGNTVSVVGTDGTVYVSGDSDHTVTVESYTEEADLNGASSLDDWEDFEVEKM